MSYEYAVFEHCSFYNLTQFYLLKKKLLIKYVQY